MPVSESLVVIYGGAVSDDAEGLKLNRDSKDRCDKGIFEVKCQQQKGRNAKIFYSVDDKIPNLREVTLEYLYRAGVPPEPGYAPPVAHNTLQETRAVAQFAQEQKIASVILVSSWYHLPRVWIMWRFLTTFSGKIRFRPSWKMTTPYESFKWEIESFKKGWRLRHGL